MDVMGHAALGEVTLKWLTTIRAILGRITDALMWGRNRGLWSKKDGLDTGSPLDKPGKPGGLK